MGQIARVLYLLRVLVAAAFLYRLLDALRSNVETSIIFTAKRSQ